MTEVDPKSTLDELSTSLTSLEQVLASLVAKPFDELTQDLEPIEKARLQVMSGYIVHDLMWIYLRTAGVDQITHPVMLELQRLKDYFDKIARAEGGPTSRPTTTAPTPTSRSQLDKGAAARFIKAAIGSQRAKVDPNYTPSAGPSTPRERGEEGTHTRFDESEVDRLLEDRDDDDDVEDVEHEPAKQKKKKADQTSSAPASSKKAKGKVETKSNRPKIDPFAGYDDVSRTPKSKRKAVSKGVKSEDATQPSSGEKRSLAAMAEDDAPSPPPAGLSATPSLSSKKAKKLKKKEEREGKKPRIA